jgi:hypothetical protein
MSEHFDMPKRVLMAALDAYICRYSGRPPPARQRHCQCPLRPPKQTMRPPRHRAPKRPPPGKPPPPPKKALSTTTEGAQESEKPPPLCRRRPPPRRPHRPRQPPSPMLGFSPAVLLKGSCLPHGHSEWFAAVVRLALHSPCLAATKGSPMLCTLPRVGRLLGRYTAALWRSLKLFWEVGGDCSRLLDWTRWGE